MLAFNIKTFELMMKANEEAMVTALNDYAAMNEKFKSMGDYIEKKDTPKAEKEKYEPLYRLALQSLTQAEIILKAMGIPIEQIKQRRKF